HQSGARTRLEYPVGTVLAESSGWLSHVRISPDGKTVAFYEHPERGENAGQLVLVDAATKKRTEGPRTSGSSGLIWSRAGEVLGMGGPAFASTHRFSRSGRTRLHRGLGVGFFPEDMAPNGTLLARRFNWRREIVGLAPGEDRERNLTWLDWSFPDAVSSDGKTVLFDEQGRARAEYLCYVRKTNGSAAVLLGKAKGLDLSADGRWALTVNATADQLTLVPTGAGSPKQLPKTNLLYQWGQFSPAGRRLLVWANDPGRAARLYVQSIDD